MNKVNLSNVATVELSNVDKKSKPNEKSTKLCNFTDVYYNWAITKDHASNFMIATASNAQLEKFKLIKGQVAITKDSETKFDIGIPTYISEDLDDVILGYHCALITPNSEKINGKYLNCLLNSNYAKQYFEFSASGSGQRYSLSKDIIESIPIPLIDIEAQEKIGNIFSAIDKKIQNNKKIITELEDMAKTIYDYWFTQYDFPDENGKPYKSSGGAMVYNEELKREIPQGWKVVNVSECIESINTGLNPRDNFALGNGHIKYITVKNIMPNGLIDFTKCDVIDEEARKLVHKRSDVSIGDILFASIAPLGRCYLITSEPVGWDINESVFSIRANTLVSPYYLYIFLSSDMFVQEASAHSTGSIFKGIRIASFSNIKCILPKKQCIDEFSKIVAPIFAMKNQYAEENQQLTELRDWILPMLMNGQAVVVDEVNDDR